MGSKGTAHSLAQHCVRPQAVRVAASSSEGSPATTAEAVAVCGDTGWGSSRSKAVPCRYGLGVLGFRVGVFLALG